MSEVPLHHTRRMELAIFGAENDANTMYFPWENNVSE